MVEQEDMWQQHIPCEGCAPNIQTTPAVVLSGTQQFHFEYVDGVPIIIGGVAALAGLVAAFTDHPMLAKTGAVVGVVGAITTLGVIAFRAWRAEEILLNGGALPNVSAGQREEWAHRQLSATFTSATVASGVLAASAIALLVAGRN